jgi:hypothetical protein
MSVSDSFNEAQWWDSTDDEFLALYANDFRPVVSTEVAIPPKVSQPVPHLCRCQARRYGRSTIEALERHSIWRDDEPERPTRMPSSERIAVLKYCELLMSAVGQLVDYLDDRK